ncbi:MAG TPA: MATE family efflux transporter [Thermoanaerobaculia bacterium]|nr:MATE family efflux transporter [Thermoanaerobaculia bacterium]
MLRRELRELFRLALPLAAAQAGTQFMTIVDIAVLGRYSARDLAAVGFANSFYFGVTVIGMGAVFGIDPLISQAVGAGDAIRARRALWQGIWFAIAVTAVLTVPLLAGAVVMRHVGVEHELIEPATQYLLIRATGLGPLLLFLVIRAYLQALSITRPMIIAMVAANIINFFGDILLVFGAGPVPALGAAGAAMSTVAASLIELAIVAIAVKAVSVPPHSENVRRWNTADVLRAARVGWPVSLQLGAEVGIFALVGVLAALLGTVPLAAHQVVLGLASFTYTAALGTANAGSVRVGIAVGSRNVAATQRAGRAAFIGGAAIMSIGALTFALAPGTLARLVTNKPEVIAAAIPLFIIAALFQLSDGLQAVGSGVLRGAGDTHYGFVANLVGHWLVGAPLALYLGFNRGMGIVGLWWGLCAGLTAVALMLVHRFERLSASPIVPVAERH